MDGQFSHCLLVCVAQGQGMGLISVVHGLPQDPGFPEGAYVYGIADYGNIIAVAPDSEHTEFIW